MAVGGSLVAGGLAETVDCTGVEVGGDGDVGSGGGVLGGVGGTAATGWAVGEGVDVGMGDGSGEGEGGGDATGATVAVGWEIGVGVGEGGAVAVSSGADVAGGVPDTPSTSVWVCSPALLTTRRLYSWGAVGQTSRLPLLLICLPSRYIS